MKTSKYANLLIGAYMVAHPFTTTVVSKPINDLPKIRYRSEKLNWEKMNPKDWDKLNPYQRTLAYNTLIKHWVNHYKLSSTENPSDDIEMALRNIFYNESRLNRRAISQNNDIGISQVSPAMRKKIKELHESGQLDFSVSDDDYFNPVHAIRAGVWLFSQMLNAAKGDMMKAISMYYRGNNWDDELGHKYRRHTEQLMKTFPTVESMALYQDFVEKKFKKSKINTD